MAPDQLLGKVIDVPKTATWSLAAGLALLMLSGCAAGPNELVDTGRDPAGFWLGLWHGLISPITFVISLFTSEVNVYEVRNSGNWYDFRFVLGVSVAFGGRQPREHGWRTTSSPPWTGRGVELR